MNKGRVQELRINDYQEYNQLSNEYKKYFERFILSKIDLLKYDDMIKNSELGFGNVTDNITLKSNLDEYMNLNHFFVLNSFYIEKLNNNQIEKLKNGTDNDKYSLVMSTYKEIIKSNYHNGEYTDKIYKINYLNTTSNNGFFDNDSLVLAIYYGKNKNKYGNKEKYLDNYVKKKEFLNNIINEIKNVIEKELGIKCNIVNNKI